MAKRPGFTLPLRLSRLSHWPHWGAPRSSSLVKDRCVVKSEVLYEQIRKVRRGSLLGFLFSGTAPRVYAP